MALTVSFTATQAAGEPSEIIFTDTSTGTDATITTRRIYIQTYAGTYLVESGTSTDYEVWALPLATAITLDVLTQDRAVDITIQWLAGSTVVYTSTATYGFTLYNETFLYSLTQAQAAQGNPPPTVLGDTVYFSNKMKMRELVDSGDQAVSLADDITTAQNCYDQATEMRLKENYYF